MLNYSVAELRYYTPIGQNIIDLTTYLPIWTQDALWDNPYYELVNIIKKYI